MIFQDPLSSLHPFYKIGWQIIELLRAHGHSLDRRAARRRSIELLELVGIPEASRRVDDYPHQLSGGMRQRVMIAMAMALNPSLLIADEPTTALDVTVQAQILGVLKNLQRSFAMAIILITHDLGVIAEVADEVVVMYAGSEMERAPRRELFYEGHHPYTIGLLRSLPSYEEVSTLTATTSRATPQAEVADEASLNETPGLDLQPRALKRQRLFSIPGQPPSLLGLAPGCPFSPRCEQRMERCTKERPPLIQVGPDHESACWLATLTTVGSSTADKDQSPFGGTSTALPDGSVASR
jgi:peptide/nickel transport system ATP-binding protein